LYGGDGNDRMNGGTGNDTLKGGSGVDILTGGLGADVFYFAATTDTGIGFSARDKIEDFQTGLDKINLRAIDADATLSGDQAFHFTPGGQFDGRAGSLRFVNSAGDTLVLVDLNGDKVTDFAIQLEGSHQLAATDFIL
jgi:serralysin